jgi:hypothetical protein
MLKVSFHKKIVPVLCLLLLIISGCTNLKELKPEEFSTKEYYIKTVEVKTSLKQIIRMHPLYILNNAYSMSFPKILPSSHKAQVWWEVDGFMNMSTMAMIQFEQPDLDKPRVIAKIYAANSMWAKHPEKYINLLEYKFDK